MNLMHRRFSIFAYLLTTLLLSSCGRYLVTLNETTLYKPAPLFLNFDMVDQALYTCIAEHVRQHKITAAEQLQSLNCSHANIENLEGLWVFSELEELNLSHNRLGNLAELRSLQKLKHLDLSANPISDLSDLFFLADLEVLKLQQNPAISCQEAHKLSRYVKQLVEMPEQCATGS